MNRTLKSIVITVRVTPSEAHLLREAAARADCSVSSLIRARCFAARGGTIFASNTTGSGLVPGIEWASTTPSGTTE